MMNDFAIFILTHGRPYNQKTYNSLRQQGYTGKIILVLDDEDESINDYKNNSDLLADIIVFNKETYIQKTDCGNSNPYRKFAVFARNAIEDIARKLNYKFFGMFDDDIVRFRYRLIEDDSIKSYDCIDLDSVFKEHIEYMKFTNIACMSFGTQNNYIGGLKNGCFAKCGFNKQRICFNAYIRNADYDVHWRLNIGEDRTTSILYSTVGQVWLQSLLIQIDLLPFEGEIDGGNSDVYRQVSKFRQKFYDIVPCPSVYTMRVKSEKLSTFMNESAVCPKIISDKYKKPVQ